MDARSAFLGQGLCHRSRQGVARLRLPQLSRREAHFPHRPRKPRLATGCRANRRNQGTAPDALHRGTKLRGGLLGDRPPRVELRAASCPAPAMVLLSSRFRRRWGTLLLMVRLRPKRIAFAAWLGIL